MVIWFYYFVVIWYIFPRFGTLYQEKSGSPAPNFHCSQVFVCIMERLRQEHRNLEEACLKKTENFFQLIYSLFCLTSEKSIC
jgi:hypothetical protein